MWWVTLPSANSYIDTALVMVNRKVLEQHETVEGETANTM